MIPTCANQRRRLLAPLVAMLALNAGTARAVMINTFSGTGNTTAPADDPGWANIGTRGIGSGVYLGNGWVLTARHNSSGNFVLSGTTYMMVPGSQVDIQNLGTPDKSTNTDLIMFQINGDPGLPALSIATAAPANGSAVTMIGAGRNRGAFTTWNVNVDTTPYTWTIDSENPNAAGYFWGTTRTMRWGTNVISSTGWLNYTIGDNFDVLTLRTTFNDSAGYSNEAQAAPGDSGGAVFFKNGSQWELAGIMVVTDGFSGQPAQTAVFGNQTFMADLSFYRSQIVVVVPEPGAATLAGVALAACAAWAAGRRRPHA